MKSPRSITLEFWSKALAWSGSATPRVLPNVFIFALFALVIQYCHFVTQKFSIDSGALETAGAVIGIILVFRTNSGYDRWWEARKLWGGIVNQSRNLIISGLNYGPSDPDWQRRFTLWALAFPHVARQTLRNEREIPELRKFFSEEQVLKIKKSQHMPSYVAGKLSALLAEAHTQHKMNSLMFAQVDKERTQLIDHIGGCERILKTPIPLVYNIKIRRFILFYLLILPFGFSDRMEWLTPLIEAFIAYPLLSLDHIGAELQNPFSKINLSNLPLDQISEGIQNEQLAVLEDVLNRFQFSEGAMPSISLRAEASNAP